MKVKIQKKTETEEIIDINFPVYYHHDLMSDYGASDIYGKITETDHYSMRFSENLYAAEGLEIEHDKIVNHSNLSAYIVPAGIAIRKITEDVYLKMKEKARRAIETL